MTAVGAATLMTGNEMIKFSTHPATAAALAFALLVGGAAAASAAGKTTPGVHDAPPERHWLFKPLGAPLKPDQMVRAKCDMAKAYVHGGPGHERASPHYRDEHRYRARNFKGYPTKPGCWIEPPAGWRHP